MLRASPRRAAAWAAALALLLAPLTACTGQEGTPAAAQAGFGEVVPARQVAVNGSVAKDRSFVLFPTGRLEVRIGDPLARLGTDDTRAREVREAPAGGVFLPVSWRYRPHVLDAASAVFGQRQDLTVQLVSDDTAYKLVPPAEDRSASDGEEFFVAVEGDAAQVRFEIGYAGVVQTLDLTAGKRTKGRAAGLYDLTDLKVRDSPCPDRDWLEDDPDLAQLYFYCSTSTAMRTPFVDGEWAEKGRTFVVVGLTTTNNGYLLPDPAGLGSASYTVAASTLTTTLGGKEPVKVLEEAENAGIASGYLVFDVKGRGPSTLQVGRRYRVTLTRVQGDVDAAQELRLEPRGGVPLRF